MSLPNDGPDFVNSMAPTTSASTLAHSTRPLNHHSVTPTASPPIPVTSPRGWLAQIDHAALNLPPSFFSINMGTGIVSILLHNYPYQAQWLRLLATIVFVLNVVVFVLLTLATIVRYIRWRGIFSLVARHGVAGMFWGCMPMGLSTIVNMVAFVCVPAWGEPWAYVALGLWWFDVVFAILVNFGMIFMMFTRQSHTPQSVAPTWLLPIVSSVVAAASGAVVASVLAPYSPSLARSTLLAAYVVWGTGVPLALMVIALWVYRAALHGPPQSAALASVFLPLGPCGQGAYGIISMGGVARSLAYSYSTSIIPSLSNDEGAKRIADAIYAGGLVTGLILWGLALLWYTLATALFLDRARTDWSLLGPRKFSVSLWAITFPIGVFATSTIALADELDSPTFRVLAAFLSTQVIIHWIYVSAMTVIKCVNGSWFVAPELADVNEGTIRRRWGDVETGSRAYRGEKA